MDRGGEKGYNRAMKASDIVIYSDMDGTVLTDWNMGPVVPQRNLQLIKRFVDEGGSFSVASGRQGPEIVPFFPGMKWTIPLVCSNGSVLYDAKRGVPAEKISLPLAYKEECVRYFSARNDVFLVAADENEIYQVSCGDPERDKCLDDRYRPVTSVERFLRDDFVKVVFITEDGGDFEGLKARVDAFPCAHLVVGSQSGPRYYEINAVGVDKGSAIRRAMAHAGMEGRTLACIGDYFNDWTMLKAADIAACPENAHPGIKEICSIHTCDNNTGALAELIERLLADDFHGV